MATTVRTLVAGQNTTVGAVSSRSLYTITVASGTPGSSGANGVSVTSANAATGNLIFTLSNSATIDAGPLNITANLSGYQTTAGLSANVATLTSNNASYLGGIAANQYAYANQTTTRLVNGSQTTVLEANGTLTLANGSALVISGDGVDLTASANGWAELQSNNQTNYMWVDNNGSYVGTNWVDGPHQWTFGLDGTFSLPPSVTGAGLIQATANIDFNADGNGFSFTTDGRLRFNNGLYIGGSNNSLRADANASISINTSRRQFEWITAIAGSGVDTLVANTSSNTVVLDVGVDWTVQVGSDVYAITAISTSYNVSNNNGTATLTIPGLTVQAGLPYFFRNPTPIPKEWTFDKNGGLIFPDETTQTTAFTKSYDTLTLGIPRIPRTTATNAIHAVDISTVNNNKDGILIYDTNGSRVRMYANGTGWYTFATTDDVANATVDRLTSNGYTFVLESNGAITTTGNGMIATSNTGSNTSVKIAVHWNDPGASPAVNHVTSVYTFNPTGITFPDNTVQNTAYTGPTDTDRLVSGSNTVILQADGTITIPGTFTTSGTYNIELNPDNDANAYIRVPKWDDGGERLTISNMFTGSAGIYFYTEGGHTFRMYQNQLGFPDSTWQTTAFTGDANNASYLGGVAAASYQTTAGLSANVATLTSNNTLYLGGSAANTYAPINNPTFTGNVTGNTTGFEIGYKDVPQNYTNTSFTIGLSDRGKHIFTSNGTSQTITIANNTSVAFPIGTAISIVSQGAGTITVARGTGVTLYLAANSTSADRTIASYGMATLLKVATNTWFINGAGVS